MVANSFESIGNSESFFLLKCVCVRGGKEGRRKD